MMINVTYLYINNKVVFTNAAARIIGRCKVTKRITDLTELC